MSDRALPMSSGRGPTPLSLLRDLWVLLVIVGPMLGCFYPIDSYLSLGVGDGLGGGYSALPLPVTPISLVLTTATAAALLVAIAARQRLNHQPLLYGYVALALLSVVWSADHMYSLQRAIRLLPPILMGMALAQFYTQAQGRRLVTYAFLIAAIASIFVAVLDPSLGLARIANGYENAWRGAFVHKNLTGAVCALGVIVALMAWRTRAVGAAIGGLTALLCLVVVIQAHSGTSEGAFAIALLAMAMLAAIQTLPPNVKLLALGFTVLIVLAALVVMVFGLPVLVDATGRDMTLTGRTIIWEVAWDRIKLQPWIGYGYGFWGTGNAMVPVMWRQIGDQVPHSHNSWIELWLGMGIVAPLLLLAALLGALRRSVRLITFTRDRSAVFFAGIATLLLVRSMTETEFSDPFINGVFFLAWITADLQRSVVRSRTAAMPGRDPAWRPAERQIVAGAGAMARG